MILWRLSLYYTFTHPQLQPSQPLLLPRPMLGWGYDHHAIFVQWDVAPEAYIIHHPIGRRSNPPGSWMACFLKQHLWVGGWGFLCGFPAFAGWYETVWTWPTWIFLTSIVDDCWILWAFTLPVTSGHLWAPKIHQLSSGWEGRFGTRHRRHFRSYAVTRTATWYLKSVRVKLCQMLPVLDVFQLSVGLWLHTSRVLWKMLRLTLFREEPSCKVMCSLSDGSRNIPRYFRTTTRWALQVRNIFEYTLVQRPSNPVGNLKNGLVGSVWVGGYHWTLQ